MNGFKAATKPALSFCHGCITHVHNQSRIYTDTTSAEERKQACITSFERIPGEVFSPPSASTLRLQLIKLSNQISNLLRHLLFTSLPNTSLLLSSSFLRHTYQIVSLCFKITAMTNVFKITTLLSVCSLIISVGLNYLFFGRMMMIPRGRGACLRRKT